MKHALTFLACLALVLFTGACGDGHDHDHNHNHPHEDNDKGAGDGKSGLDKTLGDVKKALTPPDGYVNAKCPIMGGDVDVKDGGSVPWKDGKKVGFCCPGCVDKWNALTDDEKTKKLMQ